MTGLDATFVLKRIAPMRCLARQCFGQSNPSVALPEQLLCIANWQGCATAHPTNVLQFATECANRGHPAAWFIKLLTDPDDWVLDPFVGSGTTLVVAVELGRNAVGVDVVADCCASAQQRVQAARPRL